MSMRRGLALPAARGGVCGARSRLAAIVAPSDASAAVRKLRRSRAVIHHLQRSALAHSVLPERALAEGAVDGGIDALARELALVAEEPDDAIEVRLCGLYLERIGDVGVEKD